MLKPACCSLSLLCLCPVFPNLPQRDSLFNRFVGEEWLPFDSRDVCLEVAAACHEPLDGLGAGERGALVRSRTPRIDLAWRSERLALPLAGSMS